MHSSRVLRISSLATPLPKYGIASRGSLSLSHVFARHSTTRQGLTQLQLQLQQQQQHPTHQKILQHGCGYATLHRSSRTQSGRRRWGPVTIGLALCPIITFGLGTWQVQRLRWKLELIENLEDRMSLDAIPLPRKVNLDAIEDFEYRKVKVVGRYCHDQEILLGPRTRGDGQPGYFLITPFERTNGSKILVRRGWVPREKKDQETRLEGLTEGEVVVEGLLRTGEQKASSFVPENNPEKNEWYSLDLEAMAKQSDAQPVVVEMILNTSQHLIKSELIDKDIPVGRSPVVELRNNHKEYIVTW
ncbi:surf-like protein [Podila epigama]|nr:surf-like protein [Podila epigama]